MVLSVQREIGAVAVAGLPMSIINCCLIVFDDKVTDRMVLRTFPSSVKRGKHADWHEARAWRLRRCLLRCLCRCSWSASS